VHASRSTSAGGFTGAGAGARGFFLGAARRGGWRGSAAGSFSSTKAWPASVHAFKMMTTPLPFWTLHAPSHFSLSFPPVLSDFMRVFDSVEPRQTILRWNLIGFLQCGQGSPSDGGAVVARYSAGKLAQNVANVCTSTPPPMRRCHSRACSLIVL